MASLQPQLVQQPSLSALAYQARILIYELDSITDVDYPSEACTIQKIVGCIARYLSEQLDSLVTAGSSLPPHEIDRGRHLGNLVQDLYAFLRYLRASAPGQTPPGLQQALTELTNRYFPKANGEPIVLIRPQWKYNLTCVLLTWQLAWLLPPSLLDPNGEVFQPEEVLSELWQRYGHNGPAPKQVAILSFAGLDSRDALLYPLLAHELGHFIDFSYSPPLNLDASLWKFDHSLGEKLKNLETEEVSKLRERIGVCLRELLADLIATRMMGFAYFAALSEFLKTIGPWPQRRVDSDGYPGICFRLWVCFDEAKACLQPFIDGASQVCPDVTQFLSDYLAEWGKWLGQCSRPDEDPAAEAVFNALGDLKRLARAAVQNPTVLTKQFSKRIALLKQELPPSLPDEKDDCFAEIMSAAWAYQLLYGEGREANARQVGSSSQDKIEKSLQEYMKTCRLVTKAIELLPFSRKHINIQGSRPGRQRVVGILSDEMIMDEVGLINSDRLAVIPCLEGSIQGASLDVHLGNWFAVARRTHLRCVDPGRKEDVERFMRVGREEFFVQAGKTFLIHPGDLVLGTTLEFISLPADMMAFVEGKSGLGRLGLIVATATQVAPGFRGVITLELVNSGTVPLELKPGMPIAQLVFQRLPAAARSLYRGAFQGQIKPVILPTLY